MQKRGWRNISDHEIKPRQEFADVTELNIPRLRGEVTGVNIFLRIFSITLITHIMEATNSESNKAFQTGEARKRFIFDQKDVILYVSVLLEAMGRRVHNLKDWIRGKTGERHKNGISASRYEAFRTYISFDYVEFFHLFNKGLRAVVHVGGCGTVDEMMWPWLAVHEWVVFIERKPSDTGIRVYVWTFFLTRTGHPIVYMIIPDIRIPFFTGAEVMDNIVANMPPKEVEVVSDSFFGNWDWMKRFPLFNFTSAINFTKYEEELKVMAYNLKYNENRVFTDGKVMVSLFQDNKLMITASTFFSSTPPPLITSRSHKGVNTSTAPPLLTMEDTLALKNLSVDGLRALSKALGYASGMSILSLLI